MSQEEAEVEVLVPVRARVVATESGVSVVQITTPTCKAVQAAIAVVVEPGLMPKLDKVSVGQPRLKHYTLKGVHGPLLLIRRT